MGGILDRKKNYRSMHLFLQFGLVSVVAIICLCFTTRVLWLVTFAEGLLGLFVLPQPAITLAYASQLTYPLGPALMAGLMLSTSQAFGFISIFVFQTLVNIHIYIAFCGMFAIIFISSIVAF